MFSAERVAWESGESTPGLAEAKSEAEAHITVVPNTRENVTCGPFSRF